MSAKNLDSKNRWRNKTVGFRVSPEENKQLESFVKLSGLTKQQYITQRILCQEITVQGNPKVYKALRNELAFVLEELKRIEDGGNISDDLIKIIEQINTTLNGFKGGSFD